MKKFAIVLAGSGVYDGSEIHEAVMSMLALQRHGADYDIFAPDINQHHVINHLTGEVMQEKRNVMVESARIARGNIKDIEKLIPEYYDAILVPGGFGVAKNLSSFAFEGPNCDVEHEFEKVIRQFAMSNKPIGALCISPAVIVKILERGKVTIGQDEATAAHITKMGGIHENTNHGEVVFDEENKIFTTPCYMLDANIQQIFEGADNIVKAMMDYMK